MEGRSPPPPGVHPFPDDPAPINKKFWGTPAARGFFRYCFVGCTLWMSMLCLNYYFTKDDPRIFGMDVSMTKEQFERRQATLQSHPAKRSLKLPASTASNQFFPDKNQPKGYDLRFDDSIRLNTSHQQPIRRTVD